MGTKRTSEGERTLAAMTALQRHKEQVDMVIAYLQRPKPRRHTVEARAKISAASRKRWDDNRNGNFST